MAEHTGTALGAKKRAAREISEFIALVFAFAFPSKPGMFSKSGADEESRTLQVSDPKIARLELSSIGELLPPLLSPVVLEAKLMAPRIHENYNLLTISIAGLLGFAAKKSFFHAQLPRSQSEKFNFTLNGTNEMRQKQILGEYALS